MLWLIGNRLSGGIPPELAELSNLELLYLAGNQLSGCIPAGLQNGPIGDLDRLGLPFCLTAEGAALLALYEATDGPNWSNNTNWLSDAPLGEWYGVTTDDTGRVVGLHLSDNRLTGEIPPELAGLSNLEELYLSGNRLSGEIPPVLGTLASLEELFLARNRLSGEIPAELAGLSNLEQLVLSSNELSGEIPAELGDLSNLRQVLLSGNPLSGCIPDWLRNGPIGDLDRLGLP